MTWYSKDEVSDSQAFHFIIYLIEESHYRKLFKEEQHLTAFEKPINAYLGLSKSHEDYTVQHMKDYKDKYKHVQLVYPFEWN